MRWFFLHWLLGVSVALFSLLTTCPVHAAPVGFCDERGASGIAPLPLSLAGDQAFQLSDDSSCAEALSAMPHLHHSGDVPGVSDSWTNLRPWVVALPNLSGAPLRQIIDWWPSRNRNSARDWVGSLDRPPQEKA